MRTFTAVKIESVNCDGDLVDSGSEELRACRVCLATDIKLFNLHVYRLAQTFGDLTGTPVSASDGFPQHICSVCGALLCKSAQFRNKCRQTHISLQDSRVKTPVITTDYIRTMDRIDLIFLTATNTLTLDSLQKADVDEKKQRKKHKNEELEVKKETFFEIPPIDDYSSNINNDLDDNFDDFLENIDGGEIVEAHSIKVEDEFLAEHYSLRSKKKKKDSNTKVKKKKALKRIRKIKTENSDTELTDTEFNSKIKEPKKKRLYNRKTEEDFVNFSKTYNVEVVFLTREQQLQEIQSRKEADDYLSARFQCELCYKSFMKESAYKKHMATHDPSNGSHVCDVCSVRFPVRHKLMKHLRRHKTHFICKFCNQISKDSTMAKMHFKWHEGFKYECTHCGKSFNKPSSYMNHVREQHSASVCPVCGQVCAGTRALAAHTAAAHDESYKCLQCGRPFHSEAALIRHSELAGGRACDTTMRACPECGDNFLSADALTAHLENDHHNQIFRCEQCNTTYSSDRQLGIHWTRAHKGQKRRAGASGASGGTDRPHDGDFMCEVCAKSYPSETTLRYHQRVHTGERPFQCPMCPKRFRMKTNLQVHINTHTGARPYKCNLCPDTFKSYSQKHKHRLLVHTKERRHKCHMCEKTYVVSFDLKMHIRTVHMKIPLPPRNRRRNRGRPMDVAMPTLNIPSNIMPTNISIPVNIHIPN